MENAPERIGRGILLSLVAFSAFSTSDAMRKFAALEHDIVDILFWQAIAGIIMLLLFSPFLGGVKALFNYANIKLHIVRGIVFALNTSLSLIALSKMPIMDAYTIYFLTPFIVSLSGWLFLKETIGRYRLLSIVCGFLGAVIAFNPAFTDLNIAYLIAFACVFTFTFCIIIVRFFKSETTILSFAFWPFLCLIIGIFVLKGGDITPVYDVRSIALMTIIGCSYAVALIAISHSYKIAPAAVIAPYQYIQLLFAIAFGYLIFGDVPDLLKLIGAGIIIVSGLVLFARERFASTIRRS